MRLSDRLDALEAMFKRSKDTPTLEDDKKLAELWLRYTAQIGGGVCMPGDRHTQEDIDRWNTPLTPEEYTLMNELLCRLEGMRDARGKIKSDY